MTFAFFTLIGWQFVVYTGELLEAGETTWTLGWAVGPWWGAATVFLLLCVPIQLLVLILQFRKIDRQDDGKDTKPQSLEEQN